MCMYLSELVIHAQSSQPKRRKGGATLLPPAPFWVSLSQCPILFCKVRGCEGNQNKKPRNRRPRWLDLLGMARSYPKVIICLLQSRLMFSETWDNTQLLTSHSAFSGNFGFELTNVQRKCFSHLSRPWLMISFLWSHLLFFRNFFLSLFFAIVEERRKKERCVFHFTIFMPQARTKHTNKNFSEPALISLQLIQHL